MKSSFKKLTLLFCLLLSLSGQANESICFDKNQSFASFAPKGWVADFEKAKVLGACVVYYLKGETFDSSPAIIYPVLAGMKRSGAQAVVDNIAHNTRLLKSRKPTLKVIKKKSVTNSSGLKFEIRHFSNGPAPQEFEAVGYHGVKNAVLLAVYSTRSQDNFNKHLKAHKEFLMAIKPMPKVKIKN